VKGQTDQRNGPETDNQRAPEAKRKLCRPLSLSEFTFDEIVETALSTKPRKKKAVQDEPSKRVEE